MLFDDFCGLLPGAAVPLVLLPSSPLSYVAQGLADFVAPKLKPRLDVDAPSHPKVLVVSAPGAVGKSTLARELASSPLMNG
jgi:Mrp family chromosome partitioning ATPase